MAEETEWLGTKDAAARLGITLRSLYRFIDEGDLPAYRFGRVIRMKGDDIDTFIESCRIRPGQLEHLYPPLKVADTEDSHFERGEGGLEGGSDAEGGEGGEGDGDEGDLEGFDDQESGTDQ